MQLMHLVLLFTGTIHATSSLKMQLQDAIAAKSITEDMNIAMQVSSNRTTVSMQIQ